MIDYEGGSVVVYKDLKATTKKKKRKRVIPKYIAIKKKNKNG